MVLLGTNLSQLKYSSAKACQQGEQTQAFIHVISTVFCVKAYYPLENLLTYFNKENQRPRSTSVGFS